MTIKVILAPMSATKAGEAALAAALALGRRFDAHVGALHVRPDPRNAMPYMGEGMSGVVVQEIMTAAERDAAERARATRAVFDRYCEEGHVPYVDAPPGPGRLSVSWHEETGREDELVAHYARLADITVVGERPTAEAAETTGMAMEAALLGSGRPVLAAPAGVGEEFGNRVAIAWSGSAEGAHAVAAAMPFLRAADGVVAISVGAADEARRNADNLTRYLSWHGIEAQGEAVTAGNGGTGTTILAETERLGADMLVMGAYTHNRFRQMIFGGVTRHVLAAAALPVLIAH